MPDRGQGARTVIPAAPSFKVLQEAAEWFAVLGAPAVDAAQRQRWRQWHDADPAHQLAWSQVEAISGKFLDLPGSGKPMAHRVLDAAAAGQARRRRALKMLALLCAGGVGSWGALQAVPWRQWAASHHTGLGERHEIRLADGASIWLNTHSAIDVDYSADLRRIRLVAGEILVATAPDIQSPARPFVVDTAQARLRALGTRYSIYQQEDASVVAVFEGAVRVEPTSEGAAGSILHAGEQARITRSGAGPVEAAATARRSWAEGLIVAENMRLGDFVEELSRYRRGYLGCAPAIADLRIVGTYATADTRQVLATLEATLPVRVRMPMPWWTVLEPR
ncbi:MAG: FecR domain-containing protein [Achromobacter sp.]|uniref:FecR domain-containing protein n=1 Tax=Achromobacter sp. TaxID=134375 RepID=UPI002589B2F0|nr:FecR domain-containing protein [Achromobacter sp.]MCW0207636.1 FecR domain-containing protein [Achromobacter sp.]